MQSQLVCAGCRTVLLYPRGASSVRCAICSTITALPVAGSGMAQLVCAGCRTLLMYTSGASSVRCSCCNTINVARQGNAAPASSIECGHCRTMLMYPSGAPTVKCAVCHYVTTVGMNTMQMHLPPYRTNSSMPSPQPSSSTSSSGSVSQTVVVENPMSVDESGKLVSNVVVGVTTGKK